MPSYSGKFLYTDETGGAVSQGPCELRFDQETCVLTPANGAPLAFDLGDIDRTTPAEWDLQLSLYTGRTLTLKQFGAAFSDMSRELLAAWRDRTVRCLLLEDLGEINRYPGAANGMPAEIRIFKTNIAILPQAGLPIQWRLADLDSLVFDDANYSIVLSRPGERLTLSKLARKTDEVFGHLQEAHTALRDHSAGALHDVFPFLNADQLARLLQIMPEGRSAPLPALDAIHPKLSESLIARAVTPAHKPYFDALQSRAGREPLFAGFKFVADTPDSAADPPASEAGDSSQAAEPDTEASADPLFYWFFFPLSGNLVAWEATTGTGRATYLFRAAQPLAESIASLTRGLALVNFRREPIYLPDASLEQQRFHRYAIGARKLPDLRRLRAAYTGRAVHSSIATWSTQLDSALTSH
jgi:hypothetical protein